MTFYVSTRRQLLAANVLLQRVTSSPVRWMTTCWRKKLKKTKNKKEKHNKVFFVCNFWFVCKGYRQVAMKSDEILLRVHVPLGTPSTFVSSFKQSQRREDDIAIVTCCLRFDLDKVSEPNWQKDNTKIWIEWSKDYQWFFQCLFFFLKKKNFNSIQSLTKVERALLAFGGMAPTTGKKTIESNVY